MLLEEAKEILEKNGYRLDEAAGKRITKVATINGKEVKFVGTQTTIKRRVRGQSVERLVTRCSADIYPNCEWFPQVDFGDKMASFSCDGYEPETPEFEDVDAIASAIIFELKGWEQEKTADEIIAELKGA